MSFHSPGPITLNDLFANDFLFALGIFHVVYLNGLTHLHSLTYLSFIEEEFLAGP